MIDRRKLAEILAEKNKLKAQGQQFQPKNPDPMGNVGKSTFPQPSSEFQVAGKKPKAYKFPSLGKFIKPTPLF